MRRFLSRREALVWIGGLVAVGCGSTPEPTATVDSGPPPPKPDAGTNDTGAPDVAVEAGPPPTPEELLAGIDHIVVLMMENRSFDHYLGSLKSDGKYTAASIVDGLTGNESNPAPDNTPVPVFKLSNFTPDDPAHSWDASHAQWNAGKNDGFVKAHAGSSQNEVMGYHDRSQLPFYYWLADNFAICDSWYASVMGPTWPNRFYLHACTSKGKQGNTPFLTGAPTTIWKKLKDAGKTFKNYRAGIVAWYTGAFVGELLNLNPVVAMSEFFDDAQKGTLPDFSIIDPDFAAADDHPDHDIKKGQVFVASVYKALAASPSWSKTLLIVTYDEHGGFFDHVPPPKTVDPEAGFDQLGFRVPTFVIGGMVKKGHVDKTVYDHCSVAATVRTRFGIQSLGPRMDAAKSIAACIDPETYKSPSPPPQNMPMPIKMSLDEALEYRVGTSSQPELDAMIADGTIPRDQVDARPARERLGDWMYRADKLGVVTLRPRPPLR